ncbi:hypothetical protein [Paenibacillus rubinfantis]|uniref:hypothetical protein n=1 Tax=Paenibacillus rubinfantis TaxID=1720296 RepID=UPI00073E130F|nr:hypothetical protein [Paenibacillus rubinfantis]
MNTRQKAITSLVDFVNSKESGVLIIGTHQYQKHVLALQTLAQLKGPSTILLRVNSMRNLGTILEDHATTYKTGTGYEIGNHTIYIDSINTTSWRKTPVNVDYSVIYPIDSICRSNSKERIMDDLKRRTTKKMFLASWTDNYDYDWLAPYIDRTVIYDVEEEDPEYHKRMIDSTSKF